MVAKAGGSTPRSSSQIELSEHFSHSEVSQVTPSSSDDLEVETGVSRSNSKDYHDESATLIDIAALSNYENRQAKFSFRELARFFGPGLLTCVAYVVISSALQSTSWCAPATQCT